MCYIIFVTSNALAVTHYGRSHGGPRDDGVGGAVKGVLRRDADVDALDVRWSGCRLCKKYYTVIWDTLCTCGEFLTRLNGHSGRERRMKGL